MTASVSNLVVLKVFTVVADVGDKNGLQCGGCSPAYLEVLRSMGLLFLQLCLPRHSWKESYKNIWHH